MSNTQELYKNYEAKMQRIADIRNANAVLQWDQETYLPKKGGSFRGQQISTLSEIAHQFFSEEELGNLLQELSEKEDLSIPQKRNIELTREDYTKNKKYTSEFVRRLAEQTNKTFHAWIESRRQGSFSYFKKDLDALVELKKQETHILGFEQHPYNALLNEFEKGATVELIDKTFTGLLPSLKKLLDEIAGKPQVDDSFLYQHFQKEQQWNCGMFLIKQLHFDFEAGGRIS
ncbi:MAG: carboxypeptidase M32, partial [Chitinophagaceae bacterium]